MKKWLQSWYIRGIIVSVVAAGALAAGCSKTEGSGEDADASAWSPDARIEDGSGTETFDGDTAPPPRDVGSGDETDGASGDGETGTEGDIRETGDSGPDADDGPSENGWGYIQKIAGSGRDSLEGLATGANHKVYLAGKITGGVPGSSYSGGDSDAYVAMVHGPGSPRWERTFGTSGNDVAYGVASDGNGSIYVTGGVQDEIAGQTYNGGKSDGFLAKFDASGQQKWIRLFGTSGPDGGLGVATGENGKIYVSGLVSNPIAGRNFNGGRTDGFLAKFDSSGSRKWVRLIGATGHEQGTGVAVGPNGRPHVVGWVPEALGNASYGGGDADGYLVSYDSSGTRTSVELIGGPGAEYSTGIAFGAGGRYYVTGTTDEAFGGETYSGGSDDGFVAAYDHSGTRRWLQLFGTLRWDDATSIAVLPGEDIYIGGATDGDLGGETPSGPLDAFVVNFDPSGQREWSYLYGTSIRDSIRALTVYKAGRVGAAGGTWTEPFDKYANGMFATGIDE